MLRQRRAQARQGDTPMHPHWSHWHGVSVSLKHVKVRRPPVAIARHPCITMVTNPTPPHLRLPYPTPPLRLPYPTHPAPALPHPTPPSLRRASRARTTSSWPSPRPRPPRPSAGRLASWTATRAARPARSPRGCSCTPSASFSCQPAGSARGPRGSGNRSTRRSSGSTPS